MASAAGQPKCRRSPVRLLPRVAAWVRGALFPILPRSACVGFRCTWRFSAPFQSEERRPTKDQGRRGLASGGWMGGSRGVDGPAIAGERGALASAGRRACSPDVRPRPAAWRRGCEERWAWSVGHAIAQMGHTHKRYARARYLVLCAPEPVGRRPSVSRPPPCAGAWCRRTSHAHGLRWTWSGGHSGSRARPSRCRTASGHLSAADGECAPR